MNYDELLKYRPANYNQFDPEFYQDGSAVAQVPGLGTVAFMSDGRVILNDPNSPSGETWLTKGSNGEVVGAPQAKGDTSFMGALKDLLPVAAVGLGGPLLGGYLQGLSGSGTAASALPQYASASTMTDAPIAWDALGGGIGTSGLPTSGMGLTAGGGTGLQLPASLGGTSTGLGLDSALAGGGFTSGLAASSPVLASMLDPVAAGLGSAGVASGAASAAVPGATSALSSLAAPAAGVAGAAASGAKTLADLTKPVSEWGADDWLSAIGRAAPGLIGAVASSEQGSALSDLAKQQEDAANARYKDLVSREDARFAELKAREDAAIQRQNELVKLGMSREDARFAELKERENAAIARQRGDIEYGRAQTHPYRTRLSELYANPDSFLNSNEVRKPVQMGSDILARSLSVGGNPIGSGNALQQLQSYSADQLFSRLGEEKDRLGLLGGLSSFGQSGASVPGTGSSLPGNTNTFIPGTSSSLPNSTNAGSNISTDAGSKLSLASLESGNNVWNALGSAANNIFMPQKSLAQQLMELKQAGVF